MSRSMCCIETNPFAGNVTLRAEGGNDRVHLFVRHPLARARAGELASVVGTAGAGWTRDRTRSALRPGGLSRGRVRCVGDIERARQRVCLAGPRRAASV